MFKKSSPVALVSNMFIVLAFGEYEGTFDLVYTYTSMLQFGG